MGDYPKLPEISMEGKDAYENWDIPALKRNFGEPVSILSLHSLDLLASIFDIKLFYFSLDKIIFHIL